MSYPVRHLVPDSPEGEKLFPFDPVAAVGFSKILFMTSGLRQVAGKLKPGAAFGAGLPGPGAACQDVIWDTKTIIIIWYNFGQKQSDRIYAILQKIVIGKIDKS